MLRKREWFTTIPQALQLIFKYKIKNIPPYGGLVKTNRVHLKKLKIGLDKPIHLKLPMAGSKREPIKQSKATLAVRD